MKSIKRYLFALFIVLIPFQDTSLQHTALRSFGTSFSIVPLALLIIVTAVEWFTGDDPRMPTALALGGAYAFAISLVYFLLSGTEVFGNNLFVKTVNLSILTLCFVFVIYCLPYSETRTLRRSVITAFVIALLAIPLSDLHIGGGTGSLAHSALLHATDNPDRRWHGFSSESSVFSILIITLGMASAHLTGRRLLKFLFLALTVVALIGNQSKGGLISLLVSLPIIGILRISGTWKKVLAGVVLIPTTIMVTSAGLLYLFPLNVVTDSTTVSSRATGALWALDVFAHNPLGVGFSGFYPAVREYMPSAMEAVDAHSPIRLNFTEVAQFIETGEDASSKVLVLDYLVYFGVPFLIVFVVALWRTVRALLIAKHTILLSALICVLIAICSYVDSVVIYNLPLLLGICIYERRKIENSTRNERLSLSAESRGARGYVGAATDFGAARS
jgi:hypothetical protein